MLSIEGNIINIDSQARGRIEIGDGGLIQSVSKETGSADIILKDELIFPGFIDVHVHARECADHSWDYKEDFTTAGQAAINGGVVAFADMPNNPVPPLDDKSYEDKYQLTKKSPVDILLYAGIGSRTNALLDAGAADGRPRSRLVPYKVFMGPSIGDLFFKSAYDLEKVLEKYRGQSVSFHCEDPEILEANKNQPTHSQKRPPEAEVMAIDFALELIKKYQLQGKICHCSTQEGLQKIVSAKKSGLPVTIEVAPHHLFFDETMLTDENQKIFQVNPPIRQTKVNRLALIAALKNGDIDYLATDHAPHTIAEKEKGTSGMPHLDTYGPFVAWLMAEQRFAPADVTRVCSFNPGQFINQFMPLKFGKIEPGFVGSLTVIDSKKPIIISKSILKTKCNWSPFEDVTFPGRVVYTIVRGKVYKLD
jgi:dihydroorotase